MKTIPTTFVVAVVGLLLTATDLRGQSVAPAGKHAFRAGFVLPLHSKDPDYRYDWIVQEISDFGATDISFVVKLVQEHAGSGFPSRHALQTPSDHSLKSAIQAAVRCKLRVMIVPVVLLEQPKRSQWRGVLDPPDRDQWFANYTREILRFARLAQDSGASAFSVGSELSSLESDTAGWLLVINQVRREFQGQLTYSANWDHFEEIQYWNSLDFMGISGYFQLTKHLRPTEAELLDSWTRIKTRLIDRRSQLGIDVPLVFTELGYPSQDGCASRPWDYYSTTTVDLAEQELCFKAFVQTWADSPDLAGTYIYDWWGKGGPNDRSYTPQGKPAAKVISHWFSGMRKRNSIAVPNSEKMNE